MMGLIIPGSNVSSGGGADCCCFRQHPSGVVTLGDKCLTRKAKFRGGTLSEWLTQLAVLASLAWVPGSIPGKCRDSTGGFPSNNHPTHLCDRTPLVSAAQALKIIELCSVSRSLKRQALIG